MLRDYIRAYNLSMHSGIGCRPFDRYQATKDAIHPARSREWLDECFLNRVVRKVRRDSTVSIDSVSYDVPMQFISQKVEIRYVPSDMDTACIFYEGERFPIRQTDKVANCHTKRNNPLPIDYSKIGG